MANINYEKYTRMSQKQLFNSLISAEKKEQDIIERTHRQLSTTRDLIAYLKVRIKEGFDSKTKGEFVSLKDSESYKLAMEYKKTLSAKELAQLEWELERDINTDYGDEF